MYADGPIGIAEYAKKYNMDAVHPALWNLQYPDLVKSTRECGLDINTWNVNEREHMQMACMLGVNAIITNYPDVGGRGG